MSVKHYLIRYLTFLCLLLCATLAWGGTLVDDFEDGDLAGWDIALGTWQVRDGKLTCRWSGINPGATIHIGEDTWQDYTLEYDGTLLEPLATPFALGHEMRFIDEPNPWSFYTAFWSPPYNNPVVGLFRNSPQVNSFNRGRQFGPELGRQYHLEVRVEGQKADFYIDGRLEVSYSDPRIPASGKVGIMIRGAVAEIDNIMITGDDVPDLDMNMWNVSRGDKLATVWGRVKAF